MKRKHHPSLKSTQLGVHMRITIGQIPDSSSNPPRTKQLTDAIRGRFRRSVGRSSAFSQFPAMSPRSMVPSVEIKLRMRKPLTLRTNGSGRGKRSRTQRSKADPRLRCLFQCAAKPGHDATSPPRHPQPHIQIRCRATDKVPMLASIPRG